MTPVWGGADGPGAVGAAVPLVSSRPPVQLVVFTTLGLVAFLVAYAFGLGGAVSALIFLTILVVGVTLRVAQPILERLRP